MHWKNIFIFKVVNKATIIGDEYQSSTHLFKTFSRKMFNA